MPRSVAERVEAPDHAGALDGAHAVGQARGVARLLVRVGLWADGPVSGAVSSLPAIDSTPPTKELRPEPYCLSSVK